MFCTFNSKSLNIQKIGMIPGQAKNRCNFVALKCTIMLWRSIHLVQVTSTLQY